MTAQRVVHLRRTSQIVFFTIFFWLILKTTFEVGFSPEQTGDILLPYPVSIGLQFDPLVALMTLLTSGTLFPGLIWALVVLVPTIFIGRFFCGWVCPLGTLNHWISGIGSERLSRKGARRIDSNRYRGYQRIKYYIFFVFLGAAAVGVLQIGLLDPLALLARSLGTAILPMAHTAASAATGWIKGWGVPWLGQAAEAIFSFLELILLPFREANFHALISIGLFFVVILALNRVFTRFWCRGLCPLGAMLGIFSRFAIFGLEKNESACDSCNRCLIHCQGGDNPDVGQRWHQAECHLCLNCQPACPQGALRFKFFPRQGNTRTNPAATPKISITRRKLLGSLAGGVALYPLFRASDTTAARPNAELIRPPFSVPEPDFRARCIRCGQCMRVCPNNALHPTLLEAGIEGIWSPMLVARIGYCEPTCTLCGQVCPTEAIEPFTTAQKVGSEEVPPNRIGTAFVDRGRCLPWAMATPCIVCEEWCPTSPKAIYLREEETTDRAGHRVRVKRPHVDPSLCTGCGACEYACPVSDRAAIYVTAVGESRSEENQILLRRRGEARERPSVPQGT